jgi:hypothetical protein
VGVAERCPAALGFDHPLRHPFAKISERLRAYGEFDEVKRHQRILTEEATASPAGRRGYPHDYDCSPGRRIFCRLAALESPAEFENEADDG